MALAVRWTLIALADLNHAIEFIAAVSPKAAKASALKLESGVEQIRNYPESGRPGRVKKTRELVVSTTPYIIVYRAVDGYLEVLNILHSSQKWP